MGTTRLEIGMENDRKSGAAQIYFPWRMCFCAIIKINMTTNTTLPNKDTR
jgi:hypothetical protein